MKKEGLDKEEILKKLEEKLATDYEYNSGSILGSMCTDPLEFGKEVYAKYVFKNLGDPGLFKGTAKLEKELVAEIGELFGGKNVIGTFTTGGSEANIISMRVAKKLRSDVKNPEIIVPMSGHASFDKGEEFLGIKVRKAKLLDNFELDLNDFESLINKNTVGVVGIAGTTALGLVDPIDKISKIIEGNNIFFHVDAAFGGFILPFLKGLGYKVPAWDFSVKNVSSITADPHKMGLGIIPSGGFFLRDETLLKKTGFEIPYLAGGTFKHFHIVGTRPGGTVIAFWAIFKHLGFDGFTNIVKDCMDNTNYLAKRIGEIKGVKLAAKPALNVVGITTESGKSVCEIDEELRKRDWMLGLFKNFNLVRVVLMPHVKKRHIDGFVEDLREIVNILRL